MACSQRESAKRDCRTALCSSPLGTKRFRMPTAYALGILSGKKIVIRARSVSLRAARPCIFAENRVLPCCPVSVPLYAVFGDKGVHQRGFLRLFSAVHKAAAVLGCGSFKLVRNAVEGGKAFALMDVVTALFVQGDTGGKVQRVALFRKSWKAWMCSRAMAPPT